MRERYKDIYLFFLLYTFWGCTHINDLKNESYQFKLVVSEQPSLSNFYIMEAEVTQRQWFAVMGNNPSFFKRPEDCDDHLIINRVPMCPRHPVEGVSWIDTQRFIERLSRQTGKLYSLPSERQWEMAASAGTKTTCFFGNVGDEYWFTGDHTLFLDRYAWFNKNSNSRTHEVMKKQGNPLGLYDVYGNVQEWVLSESGHFYLAKGGSFNSGTDEISSFTRTKSKKGVGSPYVGFRLVKEEDK